MGGGREGGGLSSPRAGGGGVGGSFGRLGAAASWTWRRTIPPPPASRGGAGELVAGAVPRWLRPPARDPPPAFHPARMPACVCAGNGGGAGEARAPGSRGPPVHHAGRIASGSCLPSSGGGGGGRAIPDSFEAGGGRACAGLPREDGACASGCVCVCVWHAPWGEASAPVCSVTLPWLLPMQAARVHFKPNPPPPPKKKIVFLNCMLAGSLWVKSWRLIGSSRVRLNTALIMSEWMLFLDCAAAAAFYLYFGFST